MCLFCVHLSPSPNVCFFYPSAYEIAGSFLGAALELLWSWTKNTREDLKSHTKKGWTASMDIPNVVAGLVVWFSGLMWLRGIICFACLEVLFSLFPRLAI